MNATPARYHPLLVVLHWLLAVLITLMLVVGMVVLQHMPNTDPDKIGALQSHMVVGGVILLLMVLRVIARVVLRRPPPVATSHVSLGWLAATTHVALYLLVFAMVFSGIGIAVLADLPQTVFAGHGTLPQTFADLPPRVAHGVLAWGLIGLLALHLCGVLYHRIVLRESILKRMAWGHRKAH